MATPQSERAGFEANGCNSVRCVVDKAERSADRKLARASADAGHGPTRAKAAYRKALKGKASKSYPYAKNK